MNVPGTSAHVAVRGIGFGFYTREEILRVSVKRILHPDCFDKLGNPIAHGPYDEAMGPLDLHSSYVYFILFYFILFYFILFYFILLFS